MAPRDLKKQKFQKKGIETCFHSFLRINMIKISILNGNGPNVVYKQERTLSSPHRKAMTNLDSILKARDITLSTKLHIVKAMLFSVIMYRYKKAEH